MDELQRAEDKGTALKAIFCHMDIIGASVNNAHQARAGISPRVFPAGVSVYSGHYHKPHQVPGTDITYVGNLFQSTLPACPLNPAHP